MLESLWLNSTLLAPTQQVLQSNGWHPFTDALNPYPLKPRVVFRQDGSFKLTVFGDLHFGENPWDDWGPEADRKSVKVMTDMLELEKPDFVAINGDLVTGESEQ